MDEHREEREELAALDRAERDDAREAASERAYWQDVGLEPAERVTLETATREREPWLADSRCPRCEGYEATHHTFVGECSLSRDDSDAKPYPKAQQLARGAKRYRRKVASPKRWAAIMDAKRGPCRVCKRETTHLQAFRAGSVTFHHLVPRDFGGDDLADNIVPLCFACHEHVTALKPDACLALCASLTDAEYAYAVGKLGEGAFERVYRVTYARA